MTDRIRPGLTADRELDVALGTAAEVNRVIAVADVKAGLVLAAHGVVLAGLASALRAGPELSMPIRVGAVVVLAVGGCAMVLLAAALWPRMTAPAPTWFAFPSLCVDANGHVPPRPPTAQLVDQAWAQVGALAAIARSKYLWFRAAAVAGLVELVGFAVWIAAVAVS